MRDDARSTADVAAVDALLAQAARCRRLAKQSLDTRSVAVLMALAVECEQKAADLRAPAGGSG